jgi:hypothetical protein
VLKPSSARAYSARSACCGPTHAAMHGLPGVDRWPARAEHQLARPARAQRPLSVARTRGASPRVAAHTLAGCGHDKFFTVSTQGAWRTHLTWLRAPAQSEEGGRRRGGAHRCAAAVSGGCGGQGSRPRLGELLQSGWVLWDLPRKKGGGWLGLVTVSRSQKQGRKRRHPYQWTVKRRRGQDAQEGLLL